MIKLYVGSQVIECLSAVKSKIASNVIVAVDKDGVERRIKACDIRRVSK